MKKLIAGMLIASVGFAAVAQPPREKKTPKPPSQAHQQHKVEGKHFKPNLFSSKLNLSDAQRTSVRTQSEQLKAELKELHKNENLTVAEQRERKAELIKQHKSAIEALLTPEQKQQLEEQKNDHKVKGGDRYQRLRELNLTDNQGQKLKAVNQEYRTSIQELHKNEALSQQEKKEKLTTLQTRHTEEIKAILTQEQKEKLEEIKKNRPGRKVK